MNDLRSIQAVEQAIIKTVPELPILMGNEAVNVTLDNFRAQGFINGGVHPWTPRSPNAKRNIGRSLLMDKGRLRRSIRIISTTSGSVTIGTDVPYGSAHNEGFTGTVQVRAHNRRLFNRRKVGTGKYTRSGRESTRTETSVRTTVLVKAHPMQMRIPQRRFMGPSKELYERVEKVVVTRLQTAINNA